MPRQATVLLEGDVQRGENPDVRASLPNRPGVTKIIGDSPAIKVLLRLVNLAAEDGDCTALVSGETGTGKELVAQAIHRRSRRSSQPFRAVNAASLSAELADSLLFGHRRGAYTGADATTRGIFEEADGGTVFLDEIQELAPRVQAKLLRFMEDRQVTRLGGGGAHTVDVRVIAASNQDLVDYVDAGRFRADLYYRLDVFPIEVPPLRERREDVSTLVHHFLAKFNADKGGCVSISPSALAALVAYSWPGNVRELRNLIERLVILCPNRVVRCEDLRLVCFAKGPAGPASPCAKGGSVRSTNRGALSTFERDFLYQQLQQNGWHITRTAAVVGRSRQWLSRRIRRYGLSPV